MALNIPRSLVEFILLGSEDDRRQLQDSPILGDVWVEYAKAPGARLELLITPYKDKPAGTVAYALSECPGLEEGNVAYLQGIIAASLTFEEVLRFVVPMTSWWSGKRIAEAIEEYGQDPKGMADDIEVILDPDTWLNKRPDVCMQDMPTRKRYIALAGLILWAERQKAAPGGRPTTKEQMAEALRGDIAPKITKILRELFGRLGNVRKDLVWTVSLNRRASPALQQSVPAVKADAARTLFSVDCSQIVWAVVDSGIEASHPAFRDKQGLSRIKKTFDFTRIRDIVSLDNRHDGRRAKRIGELLKRNLKDPPTRKEVDDRLEKLAQGAREGRSIDWELVERLVEVNPDTSPPLSNHGTHVAGILAAARDGASRPAGAAPAPPAAAGGKRRPTKAGRGRAMAARRAPARKAAPPPPEVEAPAATGDMADGMCPEIQVYDFRVLAPTLMDTEFAIIGALQYIRYINERNSFMTIHGANLSLSIPHDVRNYACGRTPVCNECERLVNSGVVVVAAAGNRGYQNFETNDGLYESYAAFSVTDPGNADGVITVGATHRYWPHTYGVSFFSSRGPTGDGRMKPDLVAPGERIRAPLPKGEWGDLDGTSMAAPHVSGAAAMLMARYSELIGQPRRIKAVLCQSATDLGREKSFQGHGMLDVLRAFQSI